MEDKFTAQVYRMAEILGRFPELKKYMKFFNSEDFVNVDASVVTFPAANPRYAVIGVFSIYKKAIERDLPLKIKQDFFVIDPEGNATYYTGGDKGDMIQGIDDFCEKFGKHSDGTWGQYNCKEDRTCGVHRYKDEYDENLPGEPDFREAVRVAMSEANRIWTRH